MSPKLVVAFLFALLSSCGPKEAPPPPTKAIPQQPAKPAPPEPPDPFERGFEFDVAGEPGPIPALRKVPETSVQRALQFHLITLNFRGPLGDLLGELSKQVDIKFTMPEGELARRVEVDANEWPIARVLNQLGLEAEASGSLKPYTTPPGTRYVPGLRLSFSTRPWEPEGKRLGWIVETLHRIDFRDGKRAPSVAWSIGSVEAKGNPVPFETCYVHSPALVYVPQPDPGPLTAKARGTRTWYLDVPIEFQNPKPGDSWKGHGFTVTLRWPNIEVRSDRPIPESLLMNCLQYGDVSCFLPDGRQGGVYDSMGVGGGGGGGGRYGGRFGQRQKIVYAWCGCQNQPTKRDSKSVSMNDRFEVDSGPHARALTAYKSIQLDFRALVSEEFDVPLE